MRQHTARTWSEATGSDARPIAVDWNPDGRRVVVMALLRFVEAPREPVLCPDTVRS